MATVSTAGPQLTIGIKGDWAGLYKRFFRTPNFSGWFNLRYSELTHKLQALQLEALSHAVKLNLNNVYLFYYFQSINSDLMKIFRI